MRKSPPTITRVTSIALLVSLCASVPLTPHTLARSAAPENESPASDITLRKYCADLTLLTTLGSLRVERPGRAIASLMKRGSMNYISPDTRLQSFGHITGTGTDQVRRNSSSLTGFSDKSIDGTGTAVGVAIIGSGAEPPRVVSQPTGRIKLKKDFTRENTSGKDPFGHGSHVASFAVGNYVMVRDGIMVTNAIMVSDGIMVTDESW